MDEANLETVVRPPTRVAHIVSSFFGLGGVESMLRYHYAEDERHGVESEFAIAWEKPGEPRPRLHFLEFDEAATVGTARKKLGLVVGHYRPDVAVYHGMGGIQHFADVDRSRRRILIVHVETPGWIHALPKCEKWLDGLLCVSKPQLKELTQAFPRFAGKRSAWLPYSIHPPAAAPRPFRKDGPLVLGLCGRLVFEQKRVDRLPGLCAALDSAGLHYQMEFLGDGPERGWLEQQFPDRTKFIFHGCKTGQDYWNTLAAWDAILSVTDYEGTSIALLEAMSLGVLPVFPRIQSGGDEYVSVVAKEFLYTPDNFEQVASALKRIRDLNSSQAEEIRARARNVVAAHTGDGYIKTFSSFVGTILREPRISATFSVRARLLSGFSFATLGKLSQIRRRALRKG